MTYDLFRELFSDKTLVAIEKELEIIRNELDQRMLKGFMKLN